MEGKALLAINLGPEAYITLHNGTVLKFNSPMIVKLARTGDQDYYMGTVVKVSDGLVLSVTLDKEACHDTRTAIPEAPEVC